MSKIQSVGTSAVASIPDSATTPEIVKSNATPEAATLPAVQQDPKDKVSDLKMEGQMREAQVRSQFGSNNTEFKMPGVEVKGPTVDDPKIQQGFKDFDSPMPSTDMKWPEKGEWKETTDKDGSVRREMTDADGNLWKEKVEKNGSKEREMIAKDGNRKYEISDTKGYVARGAADTKGNTWSVDSNGVTTRMRTEPSGAMFIETRNNGLRTREMHDKAGNYFTEKLEQNGKVERESGDAHGHKQMETKDSNGWMKGFADGKGNSYSVDSKGNSVRMHHDENGKNYSESTYKDGSRLRHILDKDGNLFREKKDVNGTVTRSSEKTQ